MPSTKNGDEEAVSVATEEFKAESPSTNNDNNNRLLEQMTKRALEAATRSKMNGDQDWVSKWHIM